MRWDADSMNQAFELYVQRPNLENGRVLFGLTGAYLKASTPSAAGPSLAILETLSGRKHFKSTKLTARLSIKVAIWSLRHEMSKQPRRPWWNDYFMCKWKLTGDRACAIEIHERARHILPPEQAQIEFIRDPEIPWVHVAVTAEWMAQGQRQQNPEFDETLRSIEESCANCLGPAEGRTLYLHEWPGRV